MIENYKLPTKLRKAVERELQPSEVIRWLQQPIPRFFTRSTVGTCLSLLFPVGLSSIGLMIYQESRKVEVSVFNSIYQSGIVIFSLGIFIPLVLIFLIPFWNWLEARQTVYVITDKRGLIFVSKEPITFTSFVLSELKLVSRRENKDGSGDVIVFIHRWKDEDGDEHIQQWGFKQLRHPKSVEDLLLHLNDSP